MCVCACTHTYIHTHRIRKWLAFYRESERGWTTCVSMYPTVVLSLFTCSTIFLWGALRGCRVITSLPICARCWNLCSSPVHLAIQRETVPNRHNLAFNQVNFWWVNIVGWRGQSAKHMAHPRSSGKAEHNPMATRPFLEMPSALWIALGVQLLSTPQGAVHHSLSKHGENRCFRGHLCF